MEIPRGNPGKYLFFLFRVGFFLAGFFLAGFFLHSHSHGTLGTGHVGGPDQHHQQVDRDDPGETRNEQERMLEILKFKLDILWTMLDSMWMAYIEDRPPNNGID